jgi:hypothetical protein
MFNFSVPSWGEEAFVSRESLVAVLQIVITRYIPAPETSATRPFSRFRRYCAAYVANSRVSDIFPSNLLLTYSMERSPSWEANQCAVSQEIPRIMEPEGSLPHSQVPATCLYPEPAQSNPYPHISLPEDPSYYYPPTYSWVSPVVTLLLTCLQYIFNMAT